MSVGALIEDLRQRDVRLDVKGDKLLVDAPVGVVTEELQTSLARLKPRLLEFLTREQAEVEHEPEEAECQGLIIRWSEYPDWIELRDPLTGEWHEVSASECLPGVVESANRRRREKGVR
jgi:hypothetical protein